MGSCILDGKGPLQPESDFWAGKVLKHKGYSSNTECSLNVFPFLSGSVSMPAFLNEPNLQAIKQACIRNGRYYDLFTRLRTLFLQENVNLAEETLQDMVQRINTSAFEMASEMAVRPTTPIMLSRRSWNEKERVNAALDDALEQVGDTNFKTNAVSAVAKVTDTLVAEVRRRILIAGDIPISHCRQKTNLKDSL